jgi:hypothetical protein
VQDEDLFVWRGGKQPVVPMVSSDTIPATYLVASPTAGKEGVLISDMVMWVVSMVIMAAATAEPIAGATHWLLCAGGPCVDPHLAEREKNGYSGTSDCDRCEMSFFKIFRVIWGVAVALGMVVGLAGVYEYFSGSICYSAGHGLGPRVTKKKLKKRKKSAVSIS